jgi:HAD superfamily hydrolase (TIGR01509 family)
MSAGAPRAVLWDLDGTLIDSGDYHWRAWRETLRGHGYELTYREFLDSFGQKNDRILSTWLGQDTPADRVQRIGDAKEALYRELARAEGVTALPGSLEWVRRLHEERWRQAIASSAPRANVDVMLQLAGIERYIDAVVSAEDVTAGKPDPQVFLIAADRLHVPPDRCIVVEDAVAGIEAAKSAGMRSIGVSSSSALPAADVLIRSLADLSDDAFDRLVAS